MHFKRTKHLDPRREWIREHLPKGREGFVFEDLDGIVTTFSYNGKCRDKLILLIEHKWNRVTLPYAQAKLFKELDAGLKRGLAIYRGFYLVTYPGIERSVEDDEYEIDFRRKPKVNGMELEWSALDKFYLGELRLKGLFD